MGEYFEKIFTNLVVVDGKSKLVSEELRKTIEELEEKSSEFEEKSRSSLDVP
jgi:hypothetical protein